MSKGGISTNLVAVVSLLGGRTTGPNSALTFDRTRYQYWYADGAFRRGLEAEEGAWREGANPEVSDMICQHASSITRRTTGPWCMTV